MADEAEILGPDRITGLLRSGFMLAMAAVAADIGQSIVLHPAAQRLLSYQLLQLAACLTAAALTYGRDFPRNWRWITLGFCIFVLGVAAFRSVALHEQMPLFVIVLLMMTATCALLPWDPRWERALVACCVAAAAIGTAFVRPANPNLALLWMATAATAVLALASNRLWTAQRKPPGSAAVKQPAAPKVKKLFDADVNQVSLLQLRGGSYIQVNRELVANLSHQLRNSLNAFMGMSDLLADSSLNPEQRAYVDTITINGSVLLDTINVILDLAKIESGKLRLEQKDFDLEEVVARAAESVRLQAHEKGLELAIRIRPDVPRKLRGDPLRLHQVLVNLLDNAVKFTEHGEAVLEVANAAAGAQVVDLAFAVRDTGIGIPAEQIENIFQAFGQGDSSVGREYRGTGLGLAIAKRLVELMGGRLKVESVRGKGSVFSFTASGFLVRPAASQDSPAAAKLRGLRVLVVDDNDTSRGIIREFLVSRGAEAVEADKGDFAFDEIKRARAAGEPYGLILLDCRMPEIDGFEVIRRLIEESIELESVIPMLTSEDLAAQQNRIRELGIEVCLVKPVMTAELLRQIGRAMGVAAEERPAPAAVQVAAAVPALRILLADDSPHNRLLIKQYLKDLPYEVDMAENGEAALRKFMRAHYDLVLMDLRMPVMDGQTAVRRMRLWEHEEKRAPTPIAALSASVLEEDIKESLEAGCNTHLSKPVKKAQLLDVIRELTAARKEAHNGGPVHPAAPAA